MNERQLRKLIKEALGNAYRILGIDPKASQEEIKAAYRRAAIRLHPDRNRDTDTTQQMAKVNRAWTVLGDPEARRKYDAVGDRTVDDEGDAPRPQQPAPRPQPPKPQPQRQQDQSSTKDVVTHSLRFKDGTSNKYYIVTVHLKPNKAGMYLVVKRWGRADSMGKGQVNTALFHSERYAREFADDIIRSKLKKGYVYADNDSKGSSRSDSQEKNQSDNKQSYRRRVMVREKDGKQIYFIVEMFRHQNVWVVANLTGFVGGRPKVTRENFEFYTRALKHYDDFISVLTRAGYTDFDGDLRDIRPNTSSSSTEPSTKEKPRQERSSSKTTYKIYGKKGTAPVHTRYLGKVYAPSGPTKFKQGDSANVARGTDNRLSVNDPKTGHTQAWDEKNESRLMNTINELIVEHLTEQVTRALKE